MKFNHTVKTTSEELNYVVGSLIGHYPNLIFSIFSSINGNYDRVMAPDLKSLNPVVQGKCVVYSDYWRIIETDRNKGFRVVSDVMENPTWKDILIAVDKIIATGDGCGVFFEGLGDPKEVNGVKEIRISIGS